MSPNTIFFTSVQQLPFDRIVLHASSLNVTDIRTDARFIDEEMGSERLSHLLHLLQTAAVSDSHQACWCPAWNSFISPVILTFMILTRIIAGGDCYDLCSCARLSHCGGSSKSGTLSLLNPGWK